MDTSAVAGLKGKFGNGLWYDLSAGYGSSDVQYLIYNTVNASLGPDSPTRFNPGVNHQTDISVNADFSYPVEVSAFASPPPEGLHGDVL